MKNSTLSASSAFVNKCKLTFLILGFMVLGSQVSFGQTITVDPGGMVAVTTTYGTASATPATFIVSGTTITGGILITPPSGYQLSQTDATSGYSTAGTPITVLGDGTINNTTIYVRLAATTIVGTYTGNIVLTSSGATDQNVATISSDVTAKALTITGITISDKVYNATTSATIAGTAALSGVVNGDDVTLGGTGAAVFTTAVVGTGKAVNVTGYTLGGAAAGNYSLTQPTGLTANVTAKPLTITGITINDKVYDATTSATIAGTAALSGVETGDVANVTLGGTGAAVFTT
ncbi:MAG: YDG domain-containing protein, partial [Bacteroidota bacterium]